MRVHTVIVYPPTVDTPIYDNARGKLGVVLKPAPPIADPREAARAIARLAVTGERHRYFGWAGPLALLNTLSPGAGDWLLHHVVGFTNPETPSGDDNIDRPSATVPPSIRAGWDQPGWKGLTLHDVVRALPLDSLLSATMLGFLAARATKKLRRSG